MKSVRYYLFLALLLFGAATAYSQPKVANGGVLNGASFDQTGQPVAPGSIVSIFGTSLASTTSTASSIPLSTKMANVQVTFGGTPAAIFGVYPNPTSGDQLNVQVPWEVMALLPPGTNGTVQMVVVNNGVSSAPQAVMVGPAAPGIFTANGSGTGQAIAYGNSDGQIAAPAGAIQGLTTHPAKINDPTTLVILATGLGAVNTTVNDGDVPSVVTANTVATPTVLVGNVPAQVVFSGLVGRDSSGKAVGFVGVYQLNIVIAPGTPTGNAVPLQIQMNGVTSTNKVTIAVSN